MHDAVITRRINLHLATVLPSAGRLELQGGDYRFDYRRLSDWEITVEHWPVCLLSDWLSATLAVIDNPSLPVTGPLVYDRTAALTGMSNAAFQTVRLL